MQLLSVIIVNYHSSKLIVDAIGSVVNFNKDIQFEFIVVDNASSDNSKHLILESFPFVKWIQLDYNAGFARANNAGIKAATADVVLLLNPDTLAVDDSITKCFYQLHQSDYVAAGVQQLNADQSPQISGNFFMKGGLNHLLPIPYWGSLLRAIGYSTKTKVPNIKEAKETEEVDWISGAFMMVKKTAIEKAGLMDEDFFLYAEEVEWCSRLRKVGKLCIFGKLYIIHLEGGTINEQQGIKEKGYYNLFDKKGLQLIVSNHLRVRKQYGNGWFLFLLLNYTWGIFVFAFCSMVHRLLKLRNPFADFPKIFAFAANVFRLWKLSPKIMSGKPYFYKMLN